MAEKVKVRIDGEVITATAGQTILEVARRELWDAAQEAWSHAEALGRQHGFRNAQMTVLAPTGTIGLLMDCDTTGVEPDIALVRLVLPCGQEASRVSPRACAARCRHWDPAEPGPRPPTVAEATAAAPVSPGQVVPRMRSG